MENHVTPLAEELLAPGIIVEFAEVHVYGARTDGCTEDGYWTSMHPNSSA